MGRLQESGVQESDVQESDGRVATVMRRSWLTAMLTALYALQAPLCAVACVESPEPQPAAVASHAELPCHEESPGATPSDAPSSHEDCACRSPEETLTTSGAERTAGLAATIGFQTAAPLRAYRQASFRSAIPRQGDLPPPDLLLLKSTLLL